MTEYDEDRANDPAFQAVDEAGGGVSEGFEAAERELVERTEDPNQIGAHPHRHESVEDAEGQRANIEYGEADEEHSAERPRDDR